MNNIVKRFSILLGAVALSCLLGWAVPGAHAASHISTPKKHAASHTSSPKKHDPSPCLPNQVTVVERHATVCLNVGDNMSVIEVVSIKNGTNALAIFDNEDVHNVFVVGPHQMMTFPNFNSGRVLVQPCP